MTKETKEILTKAVCLYAVVISIVAICYYNKSVELMRENSEHEQKLFTLRVANERLENSADRNLQTHEAYRENYETMIAELRAEMNNLKHVLKQYYNHDALNYSR